MRSDYKKNERNQTIISELKTLDKKLQKLANDPKKAKDYAKVVISSYDSAASKGIIPKGRANRKKSRIEHFISRIKK